MAEGKKINDTGVLDVSAVVDETLYPVYDPNRPTSAARSSAQQIANYVKSKVNSDAAHATSETADQAKLASVGKVMELIGAGRRVVPITSTPSTLDQSVIYFVHDSDEDITFDTETVHAGTTARVYYDGNGWVAVTESSTPTPEAIMSALGSKLDTASGEQVEDATVPTTAKVGGMIGGSYKGIAYQDNIETTLTPFAIEQGCIGSDGNIDPNQGYISYRRTASYKVTPGFYKLTMPDQGSSYVTTDWLVALYNGNSFIRGVIYGKQNLISETPASIIVMPGEDVLKISGKKSSIEGAVLTRVTTSSMRNAITALSFNESAEIYPVEIKRHTRVIDSSGSIIESSDANSDANSEGFITLYYDLYGYTDALAEVTISRPHKSSIGVSKRITFLTESKETILTSIISGSYNTDTYDQIAVPASARYMRVCFYASNSNRFNLHVTIRNLRSNAVANLYKHEPPIFNNCLPYKRGPYDEVNNGDTIHHQGDELNILMIGSSYGVDSVAKVPAILSSLPSEKKPLVNIAYVFSSATPVRNYICMYYADEPISYVLSNNGGNYGSVSAVNSVRKAIRHKKWDIIVLMNNQDESNNLMLEGYGENKDFGKWASIIKSEATSSENPNANPCVTLALLSTWQWKGIINDDNKLADIYAVTQGLMKQLGIDIIIPQGAAIRRLSELWSSIDSVNTPENKTPHRDSLHLDYGMGRYVAACNFYETLIAPIYGVSCTENTLTISGGTGGGTGDDETMSTGHVSIGVSDTNRHVAFDCVNVAQSDRFYMGKMCQIVEVKEGTSKTYRRSECKLGDSDVEIISLVSLSSYGVSVYMGGNELTVDTHYTTDIETSTLIFLVPIEDDVVIRYTANA